MYLLQEKHVQDTALPPSFRKFPKITLILPGFTLFCLLQFPPSFLLLPFGNCNSRLHPPHWTGDTAEFDILSTRASRIVLGNKTEKSGRGISLSKRNVIHSFIHLTHMCFVHSVYRRWGRQQQTEQTQPSFSSKAISKEFYFGHAELGVLPG